MWISWSHPPLLAEWLLLMFWLTKINNAQFVMTVLFSFRLKLLAARRFWMCSMTFSLLLTWKNIALSVFWDLLNLQIKPCVQPTSSVGSEADTLSTFKSSIKTVLFDKNYSTSLHRLQIQIQNTNPRGGDLFLFQCSVQIEIQHEWKHEIKLR